MTAPVSVERGAFDLRHLIETQALSGALLSQAQRLVAELDRQVTVGVFGLPGSGKFAVINKLIGTPILPPGMHLPTTELSFGPVPRMNCTLADGSEVSEFGLDLQKIAALSPVFVKIEAPLDALNDMTVLELGAPADPGQQVRAISWAAKRCDLALWCSMTMFSDIEAQIWSAAPDNLQDNGNLVLTDGGPVDPGAVRVFKEYFNAVVAAPAADDNVASVTDVDPSKAPELLARVQRDVASILQKRRDVAEDFVRQVDFAAPAKPAAPAPRPKAKNPPPKPVAVVKLDPQNRKLCNDLCTELDGAALDVAEVAVSAQNDDETIIDGCSVAIEFLADGLQTAPEPSDPPIAEMTDTAQDALDLIQLLALEADAAASRDALCLLIQVRNDMHALIARG